MKQKLLFISFYSFILLLTGKSWGQPWNYDFGIGTGSHTSGFSTDFLPTPSSGTARVRIGTGSGSFNLENSGTGVQKLGSGSRLRGVAPTNTSVNKLSIYDYTAGKSFYTKFSLLLGGSDGGNVSSGTWFFFQGDGASYSDNSGFSGAQVYTGLQFVFGSSGEIACNYRNGSSWATLGSNSLTQGNVYVFEVFGNNTTSTIDYEYNGISQSLAANTQDIWINGLLIGDGLAKAQLPNDANIDSWMFYGISSISNVANIFLDDIVYSNSIAASYTTNLNYFSKSSGNIDINTNWTTNNDGTGSINPDNFTTGFINYNIRNNASPNIGTDWTVSGTNSTVVIGDGTNATSLTTSNNISLNSLTINTNGALIIEAQKQATISGTLTNNAGPTGLVIESDATGTGSLIHNTNNVPATVQRYITGSTNLLSRYYHHVSIPLNSNVLSSQFNGSYLFSFNQGTQTWNQITEDDVTLSNNQGYMIFYPNTNTTYNFVGQLNNGAFVASTSTDAIDEYSLVPNPYPSAIDWDAASGWTKTNLQDAIWIWNPVSQNYASYITGAGTNGGSRYIATGQAFFVKSSAASPVLSMDNNVRLHNAQAFFNTPINNQMLRVRAEANGFSDEAIVRFHADASLNFEMNLDVDKLRGNEVAPQLYTLSADARELSINSVPFAFENFIMPLNFESASEGEITFIFSELNTFEQGASMFLEDKTTGEMINIQEQQSYSFSHAAGNDPDRFNLHFFGVTGIDDVNANGSYQIWSNDLKVYVNIPELNGQRASIEMFDVLGSRIFSSEGVMNSPAVVRAANSGVAIVRVTAQGRVYTTKLFIQ